MRILIDLDDVLCDFESAACRLHGVEVEAIRGIRTGWDMVPFISQITGVPMTQSDFWKPINEAGAEFWENLELHSWAEHLLEFVNSLTSDVHIISSPSLDPSSYDGKVRWLKRYFGKHFTKFALTPHKEIFAKESVILIDDRELNVTKFVSHGGDGIVFPSSGNALRSLRSDPVAHVREMLKGRQDAFVL